MLFFLQIKKELIMSFWSKDNDQESVVLLRSSIEYFDMTVYISLIFNVGQITLQSTDLISVSNNLICFSIEQRNGTIRINDKCEDEIQKLQLLFKEAINYEST